jgi:hypothetical protein
MSRRLPPPAWTERWMRGVLEQRPSIEHRQLLLLFRAGVELYQVGISARHAAAVVTGRVPRIVHETERAETARKRRYRGFDA